MDDAQAKRFLELAQRAWNQGTYAFTNFLDLAALTCFYQTAPALPPVPYALFGGAEGCERKVLRLGDEGFCGYDQPFPIACLKIMPVNPRFAEPLTHRDFLGALMALGVQRELLGDIIVRENETYLFCLERMADFIRENLTRIRHTSVYVEQVEAEDFHYEPKYKEVDGTVASVRLDKLLALAFNASRSSLTGLIEGGKVFVNGKLVTSNGYEPKEGDLVSVRGMGRFRFQGTGGQSKKGREYVTLWRYI